MSITLSCGLIYSILISSSYWLRRHFRT